MFVLDTKVVSELRKVRSGKADPGVAHWAASVPSSYMFVSTITVHELEHGVLLAERSDPAKGASSVAGSTTASPPRLTCDSWPSTKLTGPDRSPPTRRGAAPRGDVGYTATR